MIKSPKNIALIAGNRLGDGLLFQIIAYNLHLKGYRITLFNNPLLLLKDWFPWADIQPLFLPKDSKETLKSYDLLLYQHFDKLARTGGELPQASIVLYKDPLYMQKKSLVEIYLEFCAQKLNFTDLKRSNGIEIPSTLEYRKNKNRVLIHPTSLRPEKNWPPAKFLKLALSLKQRGFKPEFTVSPLEADGWQWVQDFGFPLIVFPKISDLAGYLFESGYMLGNDSGIAHLASCVNIPSVVLFIRSGVASRWRPNFLPAQVVLPRFCIGTRKLKEKLWKKRISVKCVLNNFELVTKAYP